MVGVLIILLASFVLIGLAILEDASLNSISSLRSLNYHTVILC